ncbi:hypothetical protein GRJ2_002079200 [Grus japonensis]|uniref:Uncharacterized protein n=1 Tax=Grus japonensis TaxID=30415 RepID=A0ABC9XEM4_GRUJA
MRFQPVAELERRDPGFQQVRAVALMGVAVWKVDQEVSEDLAKKLDLTSKLLLEGQETQSLRDWSRLWVKQALELKTPQWEDRYPRPSRPSAPITTTSGRRQNNHSTKTRRIVFMAFETRTGNFTRRNVEEVDRCSDPGWRSP